MERSNVPASAPAAWVDRAAFVGGTLRERGQDATMLARLARDLPAFLQRPISLAAARDGIRRRLERREERLLSILERAVFSRPASPYARLMAIAGCEPGDIRTLVAQDGLEGALATLAARGVYVAFDEFKGRSAAVRGSQRLWFHDLEFDNPLIRPHFTNLTGGSRGRPNRILRSLRAFDGLAAFLAVTLAAHDVEDSRQLLWLNGPIDWLMMNGRLGRRIDAWYYPISPLAWQIQLGARFLATIGRIAGYTFPLPRFCDVGEPDRMARLLHEHQRTSPLLVVNTIVSAAVRVAIEAERLGLDLSGVTFVVEAEPMTPARRHHFNAVGARTIVNYASMELNTLGYSCASSPEPDDVHFASFRYAVVERRREIVAGGPSIDALLFTSLTPEESKLSLNVELGDAAQIEDRACDCDLGRLGLRTHLWEIRSFEKLSGEGTTFTRGSLINLLESVLPARFGGTSLDYQLVEEESADGATRFTLRISPSTGPLDEAAVCALMLAELDRGDVVTRHHANLLARAGTLRVLRAPPLATRAGKVLPFYLAPKLSRITP
jgi:hypothetical protein